MIISVGGPAGSGKSTLASLLSSSLSLPLISAGEIFRTRAKELGLSVVEFNRVASEDSQFDIKLDEEVVRLTREKGSCVIEGRLACFMLRRTGIQTFCVYLDAEEQVRAERVAKRDGKSLSDALSEIRERGKRERERYIAFYGIDISDTAGYDLRLDSTTARPELLRDEVLSAMRMRGLI
ncbi:MAG: cytidylate kinase family protein [Methanomassiliicoccales archaeon]